MSVSAVNLSAIPFHPVFHAAAVAVFTKRHGPTVLWGLSRADQSALRFWLLLEPGGAMRGGAQLGLWNLRRPDVEVFVEPQVRRAGHGSALLAAALHEARRTLLPAVYGCSPDAAFPTRHAAVADAVFSAWRLHHQSPAPPPVLPDGWQLVSHAERRDVAFLVRSWAQLTGSWTPGLDVLPATFAPPQDVLFFLDPAGEVAALGWLAGNNEGEHVDWVEVEGLAVREDVPAETAAVFLRFLLARTPGIPDLPPAPYAGNVLEALRLVNAELRHEQKSWRIDLKAADGQVTGASPS